MIKEFYVNALPNGDALTSSIKMSVKIKINWFRSKCCAQSNYQTERKGETKKR